MNLEFAIIYYCHLAKFWGRKGNLPRFSEYLMLYDELEVSVKLAQTGGNPCVNRVG